MFNQNFQGYLVALKFTTLQLLNLLHGAGSQTWELAVLGLLILLVRMGISFDYLVTFFLYYYLLIFFFY